MNELERQRVIRIALDHAQQMQEAKAFSKARLLWHVAAAVIAGVTTTALLGAAATSRFL